MSSTDTKRGFALPLFLLLVSGCAEQAPPEELLRPVRTETAYARGGSRARTFSGTARAGQETELSFRVPGRVERVSVKVGDAVRAKQPLARLERDDFEIKVRQAEAGLSQAQAVLRKAEADLERVRGLWENGNASQDQLDAAQAQAESARAQVESARSSLESETRRLDYTDLRAPVEGSIASVSVEVNENVQQGQEVILLTSGARAEVEVAIPEVLIAEIREGDPVTVSFDALPGTDFDAVVTEVGVAATGAATTFPVTVRLLRPQAKVRSGMAATVAFRFESRQERERIFVPAQAVGGDDRGRFVFVLEPVEGEPGVGTVRRVPVDVGRLSSDGLEILSGLSEGQRFVTVGVPRLTDGQRVRLLEAGEGR